MLFLLSIYTTEENVVKLYNIIVKMTTNFYSFGILQISTITTKFLSILYIIDMSNENRKLLKVGSFNCKL